MHPQPSSVSQKPISAVANEVTLINGPQGRLRVSLTGPSGGERVLLLHADAGRLEQWDDVVQLLADDYSLAALDFRGHGGSEPAGNSDYSFKGRAEDALALADHLEAQSFLVLAHSGGCAVALALAKRHPERVRGILLVDPPTDPRKLPDGALDQMLAGLAGPQSLDFLQKYYTSIAGHDPAVVARVVADCETTAAPARAALGKALAGWRPAEALDGFKGPMLLLESDMSAGPNALSKLRPRLEHRSIHGTGHWIQIERPQAVAAAFGELAAMANAS